MKKFNIQYNGGDTFTVETTSQERLLVSREELVEI